MAWHFEDEKNSYADKVLGILGISEALAPAVWTLEVSNVLLVGEKRGRTTSAKSRTFFALIPSLPIRVVDHSPARVFDEVLDLAVKGGAKLDQFGGGRIDQFWGRAAEQK